jgi:hypothetical protein
MVTPLHLILSSSPIPFLCHANKQLNCRVVRKLESYMCVGIPIPFNLNKLHCIIIAMSCMLAYDHAESFTIVVIFASVVCCSDLLLPG